MQNLSMDSYGNYPDLTGVKKILVIKLRNLGDVLLTTPLFRVLKEKFPYASLDAYINQEAYPLLQNNPHLSRCILYDRSQKKASFWKRYYYEYSLLQTLKKQAYDLVINLTEGDRGALVARVTKAKIRVGLDSPQKRWGKWQQVYTHIVKPCPSPKHTVEKNLDALRKIGIHPPWEQRELYLPLCPLAKEKVSQKLEERKISSFILVHPTARWRFKCLPEQKWQKIISRLLEKRETLLFTSGEEAWEKEMIERIIAPFAGEKIGNFSGQISLSELSVLIARSSALLCVDSAPFHMACALKKEVVVAFGPSSPVLWGPWRNPNARVVSQDFPCRPCLMDGCGGSKKSDCLETLEEERILQALEELIKTPVSIS